MIVSRHTVDIACALSVGQFNRTGQLLVDAVSALLDMPLSLNSQLSVVAANMERSCIWL